MRKGLFGLNGFASVVVFIVALALIAAIVVFSTVGSVITVDPAQAPAEAAVTSSLVHGSVTSQKTSDTAISSSTDFYNNIINNSNQSGTYYLTADFTLSASHMFAHTANFSGTLYGNGHTITIESGYNAVRKTEKNGILFSQLSGTVRDLTVVLGNGNSLAIHIGHDNTGYYGIIAGALAGGTVSNCRVVVNSNTVFHAVTTSSAASGLSTAGIGAIAGEVWGSNSTITNCTVENNGSIICTAYRNNAYDDYDAGLRQGYAGNLVGLFWTGDSNSFNINNVIIRGNGVVHAHCVGLIGCTPSGYTSALTIKNYLNDFKGSYEITGAGPKYASSVIFFYNYGSHTVTNYYSTSGAKTNWAHSETEAEISGRIAEIPSKFSVYFDASQTVDKSLAIVCDASTPEADSERTYTLTAENGSSWTTKDIVDGKVIFTGLPTAAGTWTSGGNFSATLDYTDTKLPTLDPLTEYEHGYYAGSTPSGTAISTGDDFFNKFIDRNSGTPSGNYYLNEDIFITGFTGKKEFSGTLDGNGKTIYIVGAQAGTNGSNIGGLVGTLTGTIKNVRVVIYSDVNVYAGSKSGDDVVAVGIGGIAGKITGGGRVENVSVVIKEGVTFKNFWDNSWSGSDSGYDRAIGGIAGEMIGSGSVKNCTVQLDGYMLSESSWPFAAGIVGITEDLISDGSVTYENIILKGSGQLGGYAHNPDQPTFAAAITTTQPGSVHEFTVNGFIYNMTNPKPTTGALNNDTQLTAGKVSSFGYVCQNDNNERGTSEALSPDGIISYSNIFDYNCSMSNHLKYYDVGDGNVYYNISRDASIATAVDGLSGSSVQRYALFQTGQFYGHYPGRHGEQLGNI